MTPAIPALLSTLLSLTPVTAADPFDPSGTAVWPLHPDPRVVHGYDPPDSAWGAGHRGVDLSGEPGQLVAAALGGQVLWAGRLAGRGVVVVGHGSTRTTYEPVTPHVQVGDLVSQGDVIGMLELAGSHCFPVACLHWGWLRGTTYLNPLELIGGSQIRLVPLGGLPGRRASTSYGSWIGLNADMDRVRARYANFVATGVW